MEHINEGMAYVSSFPRLMTGNLLQNFFFFVRNVSTRYSGLSIFD